VEDPLGLVLGKERWDKLSPRQKEALGLYILNDFNDYEIAERLGISKNTVSNLVSLTVKKLDLYRRDIKKLYVDEMRSMLNELSKFG
jgi:predicted DNA-binding protein YlxM (UPF0122 family)